jgi:hypothetical protein
VDIDETVGVLKKQRHMVDEPLHEGKTGEVRRVDEGWMYEEDVARELA